MQTKIGIQQIYLVCNLFSSILLLVLGTTGIIITQDHGYAFLLDLAITMLLIILQQKSKISKQTSEYSICLAYLIAQIIEVEILRQSIQKSYFLYALLKLMTINQLTKQWALKMFLVFAVVIYLIIRFQEVESVFSYIGLIFTPALFYREQKGEVELLQLLKEIFPIPMIVIDKETKKPLFHTKQLEEDYKFKSDNSQQFIECLSNFKSENKIHIQTFLDSVSNIISYPQKKYLNILTEIMDNCYYSPESPLLKKVTDSFKDIQQERDDRYQKINSLEQQEQNQIMIETPKNQLSNNSLQCSDETPKSQKSKILQELIIREQSQRVIQLNYLKRNRLKVYSTQGIWNEKQALILFLQNKEQDNLLNNLNLEIKQLKQINENKDILLASVVHDFKTPLNGIAAILQSLENRNDISQIGKYQMKIMRKSSDLMLYMIQDILDFSKLQKNQLKLCISDCYINEIIDEVIEMVAIQAEEKHVKINVTYDIPTFLIRSDPNRIKQIIMNMLSNSLKFTEDGDININISSPNTDKTSHIQQNNQSISQFYQNIPQQSISNLRQLLIGKQNNLSLKKLCYNIQITDTGCGISDNIKPKLFKMFATFSNEKHENKQGTGIGLMICKKLVQLLGPSDKISLWSQENVGTKMEFQIYARMFNDQHQSLNYISVFKQEDSQQQIGNFIKEIESPLIKQKYVRSSQLRIYTKPLDKYFDTETNEPCSEDQDQSKSKNICQLQNLFTKFSNQKQLKEDSQDVLDPKYRLQQVLQNKQFSILIVDDQAFNVIAFKILLQGIVPQLDIIEAYNGQQALNKIIELQDKRHIRYVFMDLLMPIMNGWQAATHLRQMIKTHVINNLKIVALSGFDDDVEQDRCEQLGFDAFLPKPVKLEMISEVFAQLEKQ